MRISRLFQLQDEPEDAQRRFFQADPVARERPVAPEHAAVAAVEQPGAQQRAVFRERPAGDRSFRQPGRAADARGQLKRPAVDLAQR